jgi:hypothetical protein
LQGRRRHPADGIVFTKAQKCLYQSSTILRQEGALEISEKENKADLALFIEWLGILKTNKTTLLFSIPLFLPFLSYTPFANL